MKEALLRRLLVGALPFLPGAPFAQGVVGQINDLQAQLQQANQIAALRAQLAAAKKLAPKTLPATTAAH